MAWGQLSGDGMGVALWGWLVRTENVMVSFSGIRLGLRL